MVPVWGEWRRPDVERAWAGVAFTLCYILFMTWTLDALSPIGSWADRFAVLGVGVAYIVIGGGLAFRVLVHARVVANADGLIIANPFRGDQHVPWERISWMRANRLLWVYENGGTRHIAWAIQKNGWDRSHDRRTAADEAIEEFGKMAGRALGTAPRDFSTAPS
jgi:hypothetical protein